MTTIEIIGQIIGLFGVAALFLAYQMKARKKLLLLQMLGVALFATQYFMINALSGAVLNTVCLIRTIFFYFAEDKIKNEKKRFLSDIENYIGDFNMIEAVNHFLSEN